jgi:hypothetical protein
MPRYNKIFLGPVDRPHPQVQEAPAAAAIPPGSVIVRSSGTFALAGTSTVGQVFIAQENYLAMEGVDANYAQNDTVIGLEMYPGLLFAARVATGNNLVKGSPLTPGASGVLVLASTSDMVVAFSDETYNNNTGATQLVRVRPATGYMTPAS